MWNKLQVCDPIYQILQTDAMFVQDGNKAFIQANLTGSPDSDEIDNGYPNGKLLLYDISEEREYRFSRYTGPPQRLQPNAKEVNF